MVRMRLGENPPTLAESERARGPFPLPRAAPAAMALQWTAAGRGRRYDAAGRRRRKGIRRPRRRRSQGLTKNVAELYIQLRRVGGGGCRVVSLGWFLSPDRGWRETDILFLYYCGTCTVSLSCAPRTCSHKSTRRRSRYSFGRFPFTRTQPTVLFAQYFPFVHTIKPMGSISGRHVREFGSLIDFPKSEPEFQTKGAKNLVGGMVCFLGAPLLQERTEEG